jgi:hypothetical protein
MIQEGICTEFGELVCLLNSSCTWDGEKGCSVSSFLTCSLSGVESFIDCEAMSNRENVSDKPCLWLYLKDDSVNGKCVSLSSVTCESVENHSQCMVVSTSNITEKCDWVPTLESGNECRLLVSEGGCTKYGELVCYDHNFNNPVVGNQSEYCIWIINEGRCIVDEEHSENSSVDEGNGKQFSWWVFLIVGIVILALIILIVFIVIKVRKRQTTYESMGDYSRFSNDGFYFLFILLLFLCYCYFRYSIQQ